MERERDSKRKNAKRREGPLASAVENPCQYLVQILNFVSDWLLKLIPRHDRGHLI